MTADVTYEEFEKASEAEKLRIARAIAERFEGDFGLDEPLDESAALRFTHHASQMKFSYIFAGRYLMGLGEAEEATATAIFDPPPITISEMRPPHEVFVRPFLISETPVTNKAARDLLIGLSASGAPANYPALLTRNEAERVAEHFGGSLPSEEQWEYACRAGTLSLFCFGSEILKEDEMQRWLEWDLGDPDLAANRFGLKGLFFGEWCRDRYRPSYAASAVEEGESYVIRGGGACFWPWQDNEWVWCMSAMRMPSSDLMDNVAAARIVVV
jgi:formylglycine-generating enzyme required for sulfatase activity